MQKILSSTHVVCSLILGVFIFFASQAAMADHFQMASYSFSDQGALHKRYTCDGENISPELNWSGIPAHTKSLALILSDPDAPSAHFYHWVLYRIPATVNHIKENLTQVGITGFNSYGKTQYDGPCPPKGKEHRYVFTLYALDISLSDALQMDAKTLLAAMHKHIVGQTSLTALYRRK